MQKSKFFGLALLGAASLWLASCAEDETNPGFSRNDYVGNWTMVETSGPNAPQNYIVNVTAGQAENEIKIKNFGNQGSAHTVVATVDVSTFTIPLQTRDNIEYSGLGFPDGDLTQVRLEYTQNDGSGAADVRATMSR
ncbi:hypothetical protein GC167_10720 [bacterium]|nr:hypothetical protein [bacterium]